MEEAAAVSSTDTSTFIHASPLHLHNLGPIKAQKTINVSPAVIPIPRMLPKSEADPGMFTPLRQSAKYLYFDFSFQFVTSGVNVDCREFHFISEEGNANH